MQTSQRRTLRTPEQVPSSLQFIRADDLPGVRNEFKEGISNPLEGILSKEAFMLLRSNDLINEKSLRDYVIRQMFLNLKGNMAMKTHEAIKSLMDMYPYLQFDTIRKIVYRVYPTSTRKSMM